MVRVHPELLGASARPDGKFWRHRYEDISAFERHLHRCGTSVVKVYLHVSKEEQARRFLARIDEPAKNWKFSAGDVRERRFFDDYRKAYGEALSATSTPWAPWYVIPADHKPAARALIAGVLLHTINELDLRVPRLSDAERQQLEAARAELSSSS